MTTTAAFGVAASAPGRGVPHCPIYPGPQDHQRRTVRGGSRLAVLDVDSDSPAAFSDIDRVHLEALAAMLGARFAA